MLGDYSSDDRHCRRRSWRGSDPLQCVSVREVQGTAGQKRGRQCGSGDNDSLFHGRSRSKIKMFQKLTGVIDVLIIPVVRLGSLVTSPSPSGLMLIRSDYSREGFQQCLSSWMNQRAEM
jgi:hypothetical protein